MFRESYQLIAVLILPEEEGLIIVQNDDFEVHPIDW